MTTEQMSGIHLEKCYENYFSDGALALDAEIELGGVDRIEFVFATREQRILSSLLLLGLRAADGFVDQLGEEIVASILSGLDPKTGAGRISGTPLQLNKALRLTDLLADNVSLKFSKSDIAPNSEEAEFYSLFDGIESQFGASDVLDLSIRNMLSDEQFNDVVLAVREYDYQLPYIFRVDSAFELFV